jgi:hypothetical protein
MFGEGQCVLDEEFLVAGAALDRCSAIDDAHHPVVLQKVEVFKEYQHLFF